jgi:hypothetical protein
MQSTSSNIFNQRETSMETEEEKALRAEAEYIKSRIADHKGEGWAGAVVRGEKGEDQYIFAVKIRKVRGQNRWICTEEGSGKEFELARAT